MGNINNFRLNNNYKTNGMWALELEDLFEKNSMFISDKVIPGTIEISEGRINLDLNGSFNKFGSNFRTNIYRIYGYLSSGLFVILENCFICNHNFSVPGYVVEKYFANIGYVLDKNPVHNNFKLEEKIMATQVNFGIDYLDSWYDIDLPWCEKSGDLKAITIHYNNDFFENNKYEILDGKFILSLKNDHKINNRIYEGAQVKVKPYISIYTKNYNEVEITSFFEIANWVLKLIDFLTQTYGKYTYFELYLEDEINRMRMEKLENGDYKYYSPIYNGRFLFRQALEEAPKLKTDSLRLSDIKDEYGDLLKEWFEEKDNLQYIIDLYYQNMNLSLGIETIVVNQIKMLETYYDNFLHGKEENIQNKDLKFKQAKDKIKKFMDNSGIEESVKEQINTILNKNKKNNITLREKLAIILDELPDELKIVFSEITPNWDKDANFIFNFSKRLKDTRNFYTHGANNHRNTSRFSNIDEFLKVNSVLNYVIYYLILKILYRENMDKRIFQYPFLKAKTRLV